jgi:hypothetical protein
LLLWVACGRGSAGAMSSAGKTWLCRVTARSSEPGENTTCRVKGRVRVRV